MKQFGDIYVVKDSTTACFVEFQYIVVEESPDCPGGDVGEADEATQAMRLRKIIETLRERKAMIYPELEVVCSYRDCLELREEVLVADANAKSATGAEDENTREILTFQKY